MTTTAPATDEAAQAAHDRRWLVLGVVAVAQLMVVLDATIVNIALPSAQRDLGFADTDRQWIVTSYALAFGSLLLLGGKLGDLFGRKKAFITGLVGFALASALGGAATSFGVLVGARALQGVFGALLAPAALSTLATTFTTPRERSKAFGIFGAVAGGGSAVGLVLGGLLTETLSWRWCLYVNLVFAAVAVVGAVSLLHDAKQEQHPKLDVPGTLLASAGLFSLVFGFSRAATSGWGDGVTLAVLAAGAVLLVAFVLLQQRVAAPLLPLRVVLDRVRGTCYLAVGMSAVAIFGVFLFLAFYLQEVKGFSPIVNGLAFLPLTACIVTASTSSNIVLLPRTGPRPLVTTGMVLGAVGMGLLSRLTPTSGYAAHVLPALMLLGLGFGLIFAPAISSATLGVDRRDAGVASAMVNTMQQVGGSIGTALLSTLAASSTASYARTHEGANVMVRSAVHGYTTAFTVSSLIFVAGAIVTVSLLPSGVLADPNAAAAPSGAH
ncbi:MAG: transporter [Frankiales bacterium]|nr:transporter [Frankiales bacterium]